MQKQIDRAGYDYSTEELRNRLILSHQPTKIDTITRCRELFSAIDLWNAFEAGAEWMQQQLKDKAEND